MSGEQDSCQWTRFEVFLPYAAPEEVAAAFQVLDQIKNPVAAGAAAYKGYTHSTTEFPIYGGAWLSTETGKWEHDQLLQVYIDLPIPYKDKSVVDREAKSLRNMVYDCYSENQARQTEIYVVTHPIQ